MFVLRMFVICQSRVNYFMPESSNVPILLIFYSLFLDQVFVALIVLLIL